jgi:hypothetical protein
MKKTRRTPSGSFSPRSPFLWRPTGGRCRGEQFSSDCLPVENTQPSFSEEDIESMRELLSKVDFYIAPSYVVEKAQLRSSIELIDPIRQFDKASSDVVGVTNRLTRWILALTIIAIVLALINAVTTGWPYIVWWVTNGFRFR